MDRDRVRGGDDDSRALPMIRSFAPTWDEEGDEREYRCRGAPTPSTIWIEALPQSRRAALSKEYEGSTNGFYLPIAELEWMLDNLRILLAKIKKGP